MSLKRRLHNPIVALAVDLRSIGPLPAQAIRTALWFLGVAVPVSVLYATSERVSLESPTPHSSYLWAATLGAAATMVLAALAAFELFQPDRSSWWLLLPLPALAVWLGAAGFACLDTLFAADNWGAVSPEALECLLFIAGTALPLSAGLVVLVRWADPQRPVLVGIAGGLAAAAAGASLLTLVHPHNSALLDLTAHFAAIALVVAVTAGLAGRTAGRTADQA